MPLQIRDLSDADPSPTLSANGLARRYGSALALRGVDVTLLPGECVALFGPNGAGKTTLIRVLATLLRPNAGSLTVAGRDALRSPGRARRFIGAMGHQTYLYGDLTAVENLRFYGRIYGVAQLDSRIQTVLQEVDILHRANAPVRTLSRGMQQRVSLARAILHQPLVLLLDEPDTGLDDDAQRRLATLIRGWTEHGRSVLFSSHHADWAGSIADRAIVLGQGRIVSETSSPVVETTSSVSAYRAVAAEARSSGRAEAHPPSPPVAGTGNGGGPAPAIPAPAPFVVEVRKTVKSSFLRQLYAVLAKDLLVERRTKDALSAMLVFSLLVLVTFNFALDLRSEIMGAVGPGVLWTAVLLGSTLGLGRTFAVERDQGTLDGLLMAPLERSAIYLAKLLGNVALMAIVLIVSVPVFAGLFDVALNPGPLIIILILGTVGVGAVGTTFAAIAAHTRAREVMLPVLLFPMIVPVLIAVVQATGIALGNPTARDMPWLSLLLAFDAIYVSLGAVTFEHVLEE